MTWFVLALLTAFFESLKDVVGKKSVLTIDATVVAWAMRFFSLPFLLPLLIFTEIPLLTFQFWIALVVSGSLNVVTAVLYMKALHASDLSLTVPMLTFTPLFMLLTSPIILGEFPGITGVIGIILIVIGSYLLNIGEMHRGFLAPFCALAKEKGPRFMLIVAFIWSISANFDKVGVQNSTPLFWSITVSVFITIAMFPFVYSKLIRTGPRSIVSSRYLISMGLFVALSLICQMTAVSLTLVAYVIAIKRTSALMGVLWGHLIFKERGVRERVIGAFAMVTGVVVISVL